MDSKEITIEPFLGRFQAMGCPCEILLDTDNAQLGAEQLLLARQEADRIEEKYSRYRPTSFTSRINRTAELSICVDEETAGLLDYAAACYEMSDGLFDITTGVLRNGTQQSFVGWTQVTWDRPTLTLPLGFEIDLGGICKEYAADRILDLLRKRYRISTLVNLGGDIAVAGDRPWAVGIESISQPGQAVQTVGLRQGGLATSGTTKRPGHILHPKTGLPVEQAPHSVTVVGNTCTEAGFWSTLAILKGTRAEETLEEQGLEYWCYRGS